MRFFNEDDCKHYEIDDALVVKVENAYRNIVILANGVHLRNLNEEIFIDIATGTPWRNLWDARGFRDIHGIYETYPFIGFTKYSDFKNAVIAGGGNV